MTSLALAELQRRACEYAGALKPGDELHDDIDGPTIEAFRHLLPEALARRGMRLERARPILSGAWIAVCDHETIRALPRDEFRRATVIVGQQDDGEGGWLELGTHLPCGSTIAVPAFEAATIPDVMSANQGEQP